MTQSPLMNVLQPSQKQVALMALVPRGFLCSVVKKQDGGARLLKRWTEIGNEAFACKCGAEYVNIEHFTWECEDTSTAKARVGIRAPENDQERKCSCQAVSKVRGPDERCDGGTRSICKRVDAGGLRWRQRGEEECHRAVVHWDWPIWTRGALPTGLVTVCSQLRRAIREGGAAPRRPKTFAGLWKPASAATKKGLLRASWCPSHGKRPEWKRELPTSEAARTLNDKADKAAGRLWQQSNTKLKRVMRKWEDVKWAQRALQTVAGLSNEFVDHIGLETNNRNAVMRWVT